jgi:hypothetical protein
MEKVSAELNPPSPKTTWALILGASEYPKSRFADLPASANSAKGFFRYVARAFDLPNENVLNLFDSEELPANQLRVIIEWLSSKQETLKDLIVFYTGCFGFASERLLLSTRMTTEPWEGATSIGMVDFSEMLERNAGEESSPPIRTETWRSLKRWNVTR